MNNMKNRICIGIAILILLSLGSCNSFLDIKPEGELVQDEQFMGFMRLWRKRSCTE